MALQWITPVRIHGTPDEDLNGFYGMVENHICVLDSGLLVVCTLSSDDYVIRCWAIDCSGSEPNIGPVANFNADGVDWYPDPIPDDPKREALGDLNECVALGDYTFGYTGEADESYQADGSYDGGSGDYGHVASLFSVNPSTLEITRDHFVVGAWGTFSTHSEVVQGEATSARWGNTMVIVNDRPYGTSSQIWLISPDGTMNVIHVPNTTWTSFSAPVVIGDSAFIWAEVGTFPNDGNYHLLEVALPGGSVTDHGPQASMSNNNWTWFGTTTNDGKAAWITTPDQTGDFASTQIWVWDGDGGGTLVDLGISSSYAGWTGGWYSNVRDIARMSDGSLLAGYFTEESNDIGRYFGYSIVSYPGLSITTQDAVADFAEPLYPVGYNYGFEARLDVLPDGRMVALWTSHTYLGGGENYGVYITYILGGSISGQIDSNNTKFTGRARV